MPSGAQIIFPKSGRGLGHATPTIYQFISYEHKYTDTNMEMKATGHRIIDQCHLGN